MLYYGIMVCTNRCHCSNCLKKQRDGYAEEKRLKKVIEDLDSRLEKVEKIVKRLKGSSDGTR